jgi:hypothetical protein
MPLFTTYKEQLPPDLSYPVGLQTLASALANVFQAEKLPVSFFVCNSNAMQAARKRLDGDHYPILSAEFHHDRLGISECRTMESLYEPTWTLTVYGVTRKRRRVAHDLLIDQGIPKIAVWLGLPRTETWLAGRKRITVSFSDEQETIIVTETSAS